MGSGIIRWKMNGKGKDGEENTLKAGGKEVGF